MPNYRYLDIDADTRVGFSYIKQQFYVTNKEYTTYRNAFIYVKEVVDGKELEVRQIDVSEIRKVLDALDITETRYPETYPTDEDIVELAEKQEDLHSVYYTLQDNGAYIHTLQFNDFSYYPLTIDCEKAKLYIMNSTIIYDLTINESPRNVRIPRILSFYKDTLGLSISTNDMRYFYSLLLSYYHPTCYNQVGLDEATNKYFYNNKFLLSNYDNSSVATYQCTYNPNNSAENKKTGYYVVSTDTSASTITLSEDLDEEALEGYNQVIIEGASAYVEDTDTTYSADGKYTITSIDGNTLKVSETIPYSYSFPYKECYVLAGQYTITKMDRTLRQITLSSDPTEVLAGDFILVSGATVTSPYETISCNGTYTVESIRDNVITVQEEIPTDFEGSAILIKEVFVSNISKIHSRVLTLTNSTDLDLVGSTVLIHTIENGITSIENNTVDSQSSGTSIRVHDSISNYNFTDSCPTLAIPKPAPAQDVETLIDVTYVAEEAEEVFPMGAFMVDNFEQCCSYIRTLAGLVVPDDKIKENLYKKVDEYFEFSAIPDLTTPLDGDNISCSLSGMEFINLYSKIYPESE